MYNTQPLYRLAACTLALALAGAAPALLAAEQKTTPQGGSGYGAGPGMMGGYGMGHGMMGGYGMGHGMMGPMGRGMMGCYWTKDIGLTEEQEDRINKIQDETRRAHWTVMGAMMDQRAKLRDLYSAPKQDTAAIDEANKTAGNLHQQMYEISVEAQKRMQAVLTKEQQEKLHKCWRRGWALDE